MKITSLTKPEDSLSVEAILDKALDSEHGIEVSIENPKSLRWNIYSYFRRHRNKFKLQPEIASMYDNLSFIIRKDKLIISK